MGKTFRNDAGSSRRGKLSKWELKRQIAEAYRQRGRERPTPTAEDERTRRQWESDPAWSAASDKPQGER